MPELEKENCRLCGQEIYQPLLSEYRKKIKQGTKAERIVALVEDFINTYDSMSTEDWDTILLVAEEES